METVNFEKTTVLCTFCLPHKNKKRPRRDAFCFATRILLQVFFVQVFCYKCFCRQKFCYKCGYTIVLHTRVLKSTKQVQNCSLQRRCFHIRQVLSVARRTFRVLMPCNNISRKVGNGFLCAKGVSGLAESAKHLCNASVTLLLNFVFLYGCITTLYVYCDALSLTKQFVFYRISVLNVIILEAQHEKKNFCSFGSSFCVGFGAYGMHSHGVHRNIRCAKRLCADNCQIRRQFPTACNSSKR